MNSKDQWVEGGDGYWGARGGNADWGTPLPHSEWNRDLHHDRPGVLAMEDSWDMSHSQFYITSAPVPAHDGVHPIFGEVTKGLDVVKEITRLGGNADTFYRSREMLMIIRAYTIEEG